MCAGCTTAIAIFTSRGKREDVELEIREAYWCLKCVALPKKPVEDDDDSEDDATYADTISAAVDKLQGLTIKEESEVERPPNRMKSSVSLSRKRKADDEIVTCELLLHLFAERLITHILSFLQVMYVPEISRLDELLSRLLVKMSLLASR